LIAVLSVLLAGAGWLYVRNGDTFLSLSHLRGSASSMPRPRARTVATSTAAGVSFAGSMPATELPCSIRRADVRKVLEYLATKGEKTHADLASVCKYYGASFTTAPS
jgi:hypothetical protein